VAADALLGTKGGLVAPKHSRVRENKGSTTYEVSMTSGLSGPVREVTAALERLNSGSIVTS